MANLSCGKCGKRLGGGAYYRCSECGDFYCWDCLKKSVWTTELKCPHGHGGVRRVDP